MKKKTSHFHIFSSFAKIKETTQPHFLGLYSGDLFPGPK